jgi:hypothetical protein
MVHPLKMVFYDKHTRVLSACNEYKVIYILFLNLRLSYLVFKSTAPYRNFKWDLSVYEIMTCRVKR